MTPQETDSDLPVGVQESLAEAWVSRSLWRRCGSAVACCRVGGTEYSTQVSPLRLGTRREGGRAGANPGGAGRGLEGMMLKLKLQYFGHFMRRAGPKIMNLLVMAWRLFPPRSLHEPCARLLGRLRTLGVCISAPRASGGGCRGDRQVSGKGARGPCPTRAKGKRRRLPRRRG